MKRALKAEIDEEAWDSLYRTESRPFAKPETGKIAVKVINHFGDEVMKVYRVWRNSRLMMTDPRVRMLTTIIDSNDGALIGDELTLLSVMKNPGGGTTTFITPSVAHLALDAAVRSAKLANKYRGTLATSQPDRTVLPGPVTHVEDGQTPGALYDTFLHAMSSTIFSYLAVENFANEVIGRHPDQLINLTERPRVAQHRKKTERRRQLQISRAARDAEKKSLSIKLSQVLPQITGIQIERGKKPYQDFQKLEELRNAVVHLKSTSSAPRMKDIVKVPRLPVWENFVYGDSLWMPHTALQIIQHFQIDTLPLDWLVSIESLITNVDSVEDK